MKMCFTALHIFLFESDEREKTRKKIEERGVCLVRMHACMYVYVRSCSYCFIIDISGEVKLFHSLD